MAASRRKLRFETLGQVVRDVEHLAAVPHQRAGKWSLHQICSHLAGAFDLSIDGFDTPAPRGLRLTIGKCLLRVVLLTRHIPAGRPLAQKHQPVDNADPAPAMARLREAIARFASHDGALAAHPFFGRMPRSTWTAFHLLHCSHHLSFLIPADRAAVSPASTGVRA